MLQEQLDTIGVSQFKKHRLHFDITLSFPVGTGGNWLLGQLGNGYLHSNTNINEFEVKDAMWLTLDNGNVFSPTHTGFKTNFDNDNIKLLADQIVKNIDNTPKLTSAISHLPPAVTSTIFDYYTKEFVDLRCNRNELIFIRLLHLQKNMMSRDFLNKPWLISSILDSLGMVGSVDFNDYLAVMNSINNQLVDLDIRFSPLSWRYYIECLQNNTEKSMVTNVDNFKKFIAWRYRHTYTNNYWNNAYIAAASDIVSPHCGCKTTIDYRDLFFKLRIPNNSILNTIPVDSIKEYSMKNISNIRSFSKLLIEPYNDLVIGLLDELCNDLNRHKN